MKSFNIIFLVLAIVLTALTTPLLTATTLSGDQQPSNGDDHSKTTSQLPFANSAPGQELTTPLLRANRFLASTMTCDKYPKVCQGKLSPGPDCCNKRCVNVLNDRLNCGKCGKRCNFSKICCKGKCVNPMSNENHCGRCNHKCQEGSSCKYGMCSYA